MRRAIFKRVSTALLVVVIVSAVAGAAYAVATTKIRGNLVVSGTVTAKDFVYSAAKKTTVTVQPSAFTEDSPEGAVAHGNYSGEVDVAAGGDAVAPVDLPQGAIVTKVALIYAPTGADNDITIHLESTLFGGSGSGIHDDMVQLGSLASCVGIPCTRYTTTVSPNQIDNSTRVYGIWLSNNSGGTVTVYAVRITYTMTRVGPAGRSLTGGGGVVDGPGSVRN